MLCVLMKILSHASLKRKTERLKDYKFRTVIGRFHVTSWQWRAEITVHSTNHYSTTRWSDRKLVGM